MLSTLPGKVEDAVLPLFESLCLNNKLDRFFFAIRFKNESRFSCVCNSEDVKSDDPMDVDDGEALRLLLLLEEEDNDEVERST